MEISIMNPKQCQRIEVHLYFIMTSEKIDVTLSPANVTDLPALAEINRDGYSRETVAMIAFKNWPDEVNMRNFFKLRIKERMETPNTQVFKAFTGTGEIAGFVCLTLVHGKEDGNPGLEAPAPTPTEKALQHFQQIPDFLNMEFIIGTMGDMEVMNKLVGDMKHYCERFELASIHFSDYFRLVNFRCGTKTSRERHWIKAVKPVSGECG